jgi:tRNA-splicing ligase RtcB
MPDVHVGKGAVVGAVVATEGCVVPNIVGVDIGCGMSAVCTGIKFEKSMDKTFWRMWKSKVDRQVPTGFAAFRTVQDWEGFDSKLCAESLQELVDKKAVYQLGTLGGGNHFLEAQVDEKGYLWFMVHSGSRHIGLRIAVYYNEQAQRLNKKMNASLPPDLWFLPLSHELGQAYLKDMEWASRFALENRWRMLEKAVLAFGAKIDVREKGINIHHNFARIEQHFGRKVVVHRKGATSAKAGEIGIIPGSMGTKSYIVKGLGNEEAYSSCSHGAGRRMSRNEARKTITEADFAESLKFTFTRPSIKIIDEAPAAYKDIDMVIKNQKDLVEVVHVLTPIISVKGEGEE